MIIHFKATVDPKDWDRLHPDVRYVFETLAFIHERMGFDLEITSMIRPHTNDTGIHEKGRAIDCMWRETPQSRFKMTPDRIALITKFINSIFARPSNFPALLYHDVGMGIHYHLQVDAKNLYTPFSTPWVDLTA